ncbi:cupin domain-containing protein [Candidatus Latescibacterota bacterium]
MKVKLLIFTILILAENISAPYCQQLDPAPFNPINDPDIDLYIAHWKESMPRRTHGSLVERDILTKGSALNPQRRGAVLEYLNRFTYSVLDAGDTSVPTMLEGEQEIFYIISGSGLIKSGEKTVEISKGYCIFIPEKLEFTMHNTGTIPLCMYVISEPVPNGFKPRGEIGVKNENLIPFNKTVGHWCYQEKDFFLKGDGLATIHGICKLTLDPMTIGHPHFHVNGCEEIWTTVSGENIAFLGKEIRLQPAGAAYMIPPDGKTNHANINSSEQTPLVMLYISVRKDIE